MLALTASTISPDAALSAAIVIVLAVLGALWKLATMLGEIRNEVRPNGGAASKTTSTAPAASSMRYTPPSPTSKPPRPGSTCASPNTAAATTKPSAPCVIISTANSPGSAKARPGPQRCTAPMTTSQTSGDAVDEIYRLEDTSAQPACPVTVPPATASTGGANASASLTISTSCELGSHYACTTSGCRCTCHPRAGSDPFEPQTAMRGVTWHPGQDEGWEM
jgi:hypothetical protein